MHDTEYKGINTQIRVAETRLFTRDDFEKMLRAEGLRGALDVLKGTDYYFDEQEVLHTKNFDQFLMTRLQTVYNELFQTTPNSEVIQIYTLRYSYHNLKVLLKQKVKEIDLEHLLIPIGKESISSLRNLVKTEQSEVLDPIMIEAVQLALDDYQTFERIEAIDVFMDTYYYKHIRAIADELDNPTISKVVDVMIDLDNLSTVIRSLNQNKSRSFMHTVLSSSGSIPKQTLIDAADQGKAALSELYLSQPYAKYLNEVFSDSRSDFNPMMIDLIIEEIINELMDEGKYQAFGPMPVVAYIFAVEREITNIRLILVGKDNQINEDIIRERMRPIYGS
ncbi:MAG: V-type ATPase subunit [Amphibacillus sp.]|uniref:V-type ATP synthase C subunit n=1 Tax=Amphibacillus xylanus (strain ATCC 51415 / DSM 6626 / JCM 7361 / LMG 17667 / NBRC 15112 / Ep01) TaxID=698758 RepID=K0IYD8_AMPXN|nr:V-type ATPase subunit [Amphibacillus xylanus]NMA91175.1 V-type ATPase subunit [Amphibacillus sp.]BAM47459.1 V-type ATP synthase C subunit [Amphibacillus xylanus NBRC 15112]